MGTINIVTINETDSAMDLFKYCDSGAEQTLSAIVDAGKDDELMDLMESIQDSWEESDIRTFLWDRDSLFEDLSIDEADFACGRKHFNAAEIDNIKADLLRRATRRAEFEGAPKELAIFKDAVNSSKATTEYDLLKELLMVSDEMVEEDYNLFHFDDLKFIPSDLTDAAWDKFGVEFLLYTDQANDEQEAYEKTRRIAPTVEFEKWCKKNNIALS